MAENIKIYRLPFDGDFPITQHFGVPYQYQGKTVKHGGTDWGLPCGTELKTVEDGIVKKLIRDESKVSYGYHIEVLHKGYSTLYAHMSEFAVQLGQSVKRGQTIGKSGNTGFVRGRTGCHLHFELIILGKKYNALQYMSLTKKLIRIVPEMGDKPVPVYRLYHPVDKNHFYTTDGGEADKAVSELGYRYEGVMGYMFPIVK